MGRITVCVCCVHEKRLGSQGKKCNGNQTSSILCGFKGSPIPGSISIGP